MTESIYFYYKAFIDANTYSSWQEYLNMILKKTHFHYEVRLDQLSNFILIIFLKLFLSTAGNKTHIGGYIK